jgi:hypothetical protein
MRGEASFGQRTCGSGYARRRGPVRRALTQLLTLCLVAGSVASAAGEGSEPTGGHADRDAQLRKVGEARLRVLFWSIYDSRLYTPSGEYDAGERPLRLEIEYLMNIRAEALVDRTEKEWRKMGLEHPEQEDWLKRLESLWPDIEDGDVLTLDVNSDEEASFAHNGKHLGTIGADGFARHFLAIWLSENSTRPELRAALVGAGKGG